MDASGSLRSDRRTVLTGIATSLGIATLGGCTGTFAGDGETADDTSQEVHPEHETTDVQVTDSEGDVSGEVMAAIADTSDLQRTGLSETDELPPDRGMLFVYDEMQELTFTMPDMDFAIDIIFADADRTITSIYRARAPGPDEDGSEQVYFDTGQYVLEVVYEWTAEHGVQTGDVLEFEL
ncbi:DUF192 domain-containing protein [Halobiforma nitratireducens]|uniref:DUF192 domain-containing protein n=1 Tax=Halobiforma nitratireducens JCM 10879 TaxID=1227454 RepID=M0MN42_9EURY|nr:DUF192 domain-containing protein [Halobiforma nitratireducens]EMA47102.1 hypothetical protein C446_00265 [Halobiforma nitratireducens JCM 10879]